MERDVYIVGVGMHRFGKYPDRRGDELGAHALREALGDADLPWQDVQALFAGHVDSGLNSPLDLLHAFPWTGIPVYRLECASATGAIAFARGVQAVASGELDVAAVVGYERMLSGGFANMMANEGINLHQVSGFTPLSTFALMKQRRMAQYGDTDEVFAQIVAKNFANGARNPMAQRQRVVTVEEVLASPLVADPLRKLELCPVGDGAAAVIIVSEDKMGAARERAVKVLASASMSDHYHHWGPFNSNIETAARVANAAYEQAGLGPEDLDVLELHDAASVEELIFTEQIGLCAVGDGAKLLAEKATSIGGRTAVNTSGGLLARGHPGGPTGVAQLVEVTHQLRGEAGDRQQPGARIAMAHMLGGMGMWFAHILGR